MAGRLANVQLRSAHHQATCAGIRASLHRLAAETKTTVVIQILSQSDPATARARFPSCSSSHALFCSICEVSSYLCAHPLHCASSTSLRVARLSSAPPPLHRRATASKPANMFYSHEVLTNSKYGVATIWLVATLGSSSTRRKVKRAEILGVNVPKACKTITSSEAPLALRLQSNLLYGVSSVYSQQCAYVLSDAENVRAHVKSAMNTLHASSTTAEKSHRAKHEHITVFDEPRLVIDALGDYIAGLPDISAEAEAVTVIDDSLFPVESLTSQRSMSSNGEPTTQQLIIPSDDGIAVRSPSLGPASSYSGSRLADSVRLGSQLYDAFEGGMLEDVGLDIDEHGNIFDGEVPQSDEAAGHHSRVPIGHSSALPHSADFNYDHFPTADDDHLQLLANAQPFPARAAQHDSEMLDIASSPPAQATVSAGNKSRRMPKALALDSQMEISNGAITGMGQDYATTMHDIATARFNRGGRALAQKNAHFWVLGAPNTLTWIRPPALQMFNGESILAAAWGDHSLGKRSSKRPSSDGDDGRHVRPRLEGSEIGRRDGEMVDAPADDLLLHDEPSLELGREPGTPLAEHRSSTLVHMPWNVHSSARESSVARPVAGSSLGHASIGFGMGMGGSSVGASPLAELPRPRDPSSDKSGGAAEGDVFTMAEAGPGDGEHLGETDVPSWATETQDRDSGHFLEFVMNTIEQKRLQTGTETLTVEFADVLPPMQHDKAVAAHWLMHVLSLAGKGVLEVRQSQELAFLAIEIEAR